MVCSRYTGYVGTQWLCIDPSEFEYADAEEEEESKSDVKHLRASQILEHLVIKYPDDEKDIRIVILTGHTYIIN